MSGYPDVELALMEYLDDLGYTVTATPADLDKRLPVIRVARFGGEDDWTDNLDYPEVLILAYATKSADAPRAGHDLVNDIRDRMNLLNTDPFYSADHNALLVHSQTISGPVDIGYIDPTIACYSASFRVTVKGR